jgi:hypothetical protein
MFYCPFKSLLSPPTAEECKIAIGRYGDVAFFPHALSNPYSDGLQNAVFRIEGNPTYERACLVITANDSFAAFHDAWADVMADFLAFAQQEDLSLNEMTAFSFFKNGPGRYWPDSMFPAGDISQWGPCEMRKEHPEIRDGEILLGNTKSPDTDYAIHLKTRRFGEVAYGRFGGKLPAEEGWIPIFAQLDEVLALQRAARNN